MAEAVVPFVLGVLSRQRPDWVRRCVSSALALGNPNLAVVVGFDEDLTGYDMMPEYPHMVKAMLTPRHYYCAGMNALYELMQRQAEKAGFAMDYFAVVNDDCEFLAPSWDSAIVRFLESEFPNGEGIAEFVGVDKCAHFASRASYIAREFGGQLAAPGYVMYCSDSELMLRAKAQQRYAFAMDPSRVARAAIHYEVWDEVRFECRQWYHQDRALFDTRFPPETPAPKLVG